MPADWEPSERLTGWAKAERPDLDLIKLLASFRDYWQATPGAKARKLDWEATFRNWVRKEPQQRTSRGNGEAQPASPPKACAYCGAYAVGSCNGRWHCHAHTDDAIFGRNPNDSPRAQA